MRQQACSISDSHDLKSPLGSHTIDMHKLTYLRAALKNKDIELRLFRRERHGTCPPFLYGEETFTYTQLYPICRMLRAQINPLVGGFRSEREREGAEMADVVKGGVEYT